ncbi:MAG: 30S ribosomal protein S15 [Myxococcales bacterium]|nr:30S ribosomal protein S15 [Myxococcales bacterium]
MALLAFQKAAIVQSNGQHAKDTGSAEVQIGLMTERINYLTEHFKIHAKDHHSRRGLLRLVSARRGLLDYVHRVSVDRYKAILVKFELRK